MSPIISLIIKALSKSPKFVSLSTTKKLHALIITTKLYQDPFYATHLVRLYNVHRQLCVARKVFDESPHRSVFLWNAVIRAYAQSRVLSEAFFLFADMSRASLETQLLPDNYTYACLSHACSENLDARGLRFFHARAVISGFGKDFIYGSSLVSAYSKLGFVDEAYKAFDGISNPDLVMWNTVISALGSFGFWEKSLELFNTMRVLGKTPDGFTIVGLLSGVLDDSWLVYIGKSIHGFCLKINIGIDLNPHVASAMVTMYSKCNSMNCLLKLFGEISQPDLVTWSSLITGLSQSGHYDKALFFFIELTTYHKPDSVLIASLLSIASRTANSKVGFEAHAYAIRHGLESDVRVGSSIVDMYSKTGHLSNSVRVFETMPRKNIVSYNVLISGLGLHGLASEAFGVFDKMTKMKNDRLNPDKSTFSALLCTCCHSGLVEEGKRIFNQMRKFSVNAETEHYVHLVKLLGKNGRLGEAYRLIECLLPQQNVDHGVWGALLSCCEACGDLKMAEIVGQRLVENCPQKGSYRVLLSNLYAYSGRFEDAMKLRKFDSNVLKTPGISWVDQGRKYNSFFASKSNVMLTSQMLPSQPVLYYNSLYYYYYIYLL